MSNELPIDANLEELPDYTREEHIQTENIKGKYNTLTLREQISGKNWPCSYRYL